MTDKHYPMSEANQEEVKFDHASSSHYDGMKSYAGKGPKNYLPVDVKIFDELARLLKQDPEIDASGIELHVRENVVIMEGVVPTRMMKKAAEELAESVLGVKHVENHLNIGVEKEKLESIRQSSCLMQLSRQPRH